MLSISTASISDSNILSELAKAIYKENYLHLWLPGGADWYMYEYAYPNYKIEAELADSNTIYLLVREEGEPVGYMKLLLSAKIAGYDLDEALEIERIYLLDKMKGRGVGKKMMELAKEKAVYLNKKIIFLKAMDSSQDAIKFYEHLGYTICERIQLPIPTFSLMKESYRGMVILSQKLVE